MLALAILNCKYTVLVKVSACTYISEYVVLISVDASYL